MRKVRFFYTLLIAGLTVQGMAHAQTVAYDVAAGSQGNQSFSGPVGMDFDVNSTIRVTDLGVFDSAQDGLANQITAYIYNRNATASPIVSLVFAPGKTGMLIDGSRFLPLSTPLFLAQGQYTIVAENYGSNELVGSNPVPNTTLNTGGGLISFVGTSRYGFTQGVYPSTPDVGPADRYYAGTFRFLGAPEPGSWTTVGVGAFGMLGLAARRRRGLRSSAVI